MDAIGAKSIRKKEFCTRLVAVFADLDVAKSSDNVPLEECEKRKIRLVEALKNHFPPNALISTRNGLQPLWRLKDTHPGNEERYVNVINGIIAWSIKHGSAGDKVKDSTRVLRVPGFNHMKQEPYMVTCENLHDLEFSYEELEEAFPYSPPKQEALAPSSRAHNNRTEEIERVDFVDLVCRAFSSIGRRAEFDKQRRLILDGRLTGTHLGKINGGEFLASNSHEPFEGNRITAVANILSVTNKEAYQWICDEYHIEFKRETRIRPEFKEKETWFKGVSAVAKEMQSDEFLVSRSEVISTGFKEIDECIGGIFPTSLVIVGARTGHGKSELCKNIALNAARNGKKVLLFDFENDKGEMLAREIKTNLAETGVFVRKSDIKTKEFWEKHGEAARFVMKKIELSLGDNLMMYSCDKIPTIDEFLAVLDTVEGVDLIVIDHLHYFALNETENPAQQIADIMRKVRVFTKVKRIPVVIASHVKNPQKERPPVESDLFGSSNISKEAECVIMPYRIPHGEIEGEINTKIVVSKNRPEGVLKTFPAKYDVRTSKLKIYDTAF